MKEFQELEKKKAKVDKNMTFITHFPNDNDLYKSFVKDRIMETPLIEDEKGQAFRFLLREYIFKFPLIKEDQNSAYYAGMTVNLILKKT